MSDYRIEDRGAVRTLTMDRPESRNGLTRELCAALRDGIRDAPSSVRVIVLTGANGAFCSGLDLKDAMKRGLQPGPELERGMRDDFHGLIRALIESERPTIAQVEGAAAGFGCDLALACDVRWGSDQARFGEIFVKRGLMPDGGGTWLLPAIIGLGRALELLYTGELVDAAEALQIGMVTKVLAAAELPAAVAALADRLAAGPPRVFKLVKQSVYAGLASDLTAALDREATGQLSLLASRDFAEGISAFMQKRDPKFTGT